MLSFFCRSFLFIILLGLAVAVTASVPVSTEKTKKTQICNITLLGDEVIEFTRTEREWLCGTPENSSWQNPPDSQKNIFLKSFLQSRGYHQTQTTFDNKGLTVVLGKKLYLKKLEIFQVPEGWKWQKRRHIQNRPFTPDTLDEFTNWTRRRLQERGYPCPTLNSQAIIEDEVFQIVAQLNEPHLFTEIQNVGESEFDPAILDRYSAFFPGNPFDIRLLEITSNRVLQEDLYLSSYYDITCDSQGRAEIVRRMVPAKPRLLTFGVGFDSEGGALFRARLKQTRLNKNADNLEAGLFASFIEQTLNFKHRHYFSSDLSSRLHILSKAQIRREVENSYETITYQLGTSLAYGWEALSYTANVSAGPLLERTDTFKGPDEGRIDALKLDMDLSATSHLYEYFLNNPQEGWTFSLNASTHFADKITEENIYRLSFRHQVLWNLDGWDPALFILGWRGWIGSFLLKNEQAQLDTIPSNQRFYLGGDADLRGYGRKQLPGTDEGYLTVFYQGLELRTGEFFPYNLQPLIFFDLAKAGAQPGLLDSPWYYSPGLGIRWASPIGTIRATLGRGYVLDSDVTSVKTGYQFFFSFGREF